MLRLRLNRLKGWVGRFIAWICFDVGMPHRRATMVRRIIQGCAGLELAKGEVRRLAPFKDQTFGAFTITGNAIPTISYRVFDEPIMSFIEVKATFNLPDRITWEANTQDEGTALHPKRSYQKPLLQLITHLYRYFPLLPEPKRDTRVITP